MGATRIFEMDADLSHDATYLPHFLRCIDRGADVVLGSRYVRGGGVENWSLSRKVISRGGCLYAQTILGLPQRDLTGGYKCFRREVLEAIDLDAVNAKGYGFQIEMTYRAHKLGFKVVELPIIFVDRKVGESKMSGDIFLEALVNVWKLRFSHVPVRGAG
jgi:dolichol-phosphate mannosyltransferase